MKDGIYGCTGFRVVMKNSLNSTLSLLSILVYQILFLACQNKLCNFFSILSLLWVYSILWLTCAKFVIEKNNFLCHSRWVDDKRNVLPFLSFKERRAKPKISEIRLSTTMWLTMRFHMIFTFFFATRNYASKIFGIYGFFSNAIKNMYKWSYF